MRTATVSSDEILNHPTKSLRARDYVANPKAIARKAVQLWNMEQGSVINLRGPAGKRLMQLVEEAIREGMGKK